MPLASTTWRARRVLSEAESLLGGFDRYVDFAIDLHVVRRAGSHVVDADEGDIVTLPGKPPLQRLRTHRFGGRLDTTAGRFVGPARRAVQWYCSEAAEPLVLHEDGPGKVLVHGTPGAGKTEIGAMWCGIRLVTLTGFAAEVGATAPTRDRLAVVLKALRRRFPRHWYTWHAREGELRFANGCAIVVRATRQAGKDLGSPLAGLNLAACFSDEMQDSLEADDEIEFRGRSAPVELGYLRLCTATAKQTTHWRAHVAKVRANELWDYRKIIGSAQTNPFVRDEHWDELARAVGLDTYRRIVLLEDLPPEKAVYPNWRRATHLLARIPRAWVDVTATVLGSVFDSYNRPGAHFDLLVGHDPGRVQHTSVFLRAYLTSRRRSRAQLVWVVVGEFVARRADPDPARQAATSEQYAGILRAHLRQRFGLNLARDRFDKTIGEERALVVCDPHLDAEEGYSEDTLMAFRAYGLDIFPADEKPPIRRNNRIDMVCRLMQTFDKSQGVGGVSLFMLGTEDDPCAPELVASIESAERDELDRAEAVKKGETDLTHASTALGFGLWPFERHVHAEHTRQLALAGIRT